MRNRQVYIEVVNKELEELSATIVVAGAKRRDQILNAGTSTRMVNDINDMSVCCGVGRNYRTSRSEAERCAVRDIFRGFARKDHGRLPIEPVNPTTRASASDRTRRK